MIHYPFETVIGKVHIDITTPPFIDLLIGADGNTQLVPGGNIGFFYKSFIGILVLFYYLLNDITGMTIVKRSGQEAVIGMA